MKILVADDNAFVREMLKTMLAGAGHNVVLCADGREALDKLKAESFDMVLTDIIMPGTDGIALMNQIEKMDIDIPVLAISGGSKDNSPEEFLDYACYYADDVLKKPVARDELLAAIDKLASNVSAKTLMH